MGGNIRLYILAMLGNSEAVTMYDQEATEIATKPPREWDQWLRGYGKDTAKMTEMVHAKAQANAQEYQTAKDRLEQITRSMYPGDTVPRPQEQGGHSAADYPNGNPLDYEP